MFVGVIVAAVLAAQGAAAAAPQEAPAAQAAPAAKGAQTLKAVEAPAKPKKICVEEIQLGSLFKSRICATPEQWEKRRLRDLETMSK
jgi:hypothetical protein